MKFKSHLVTQASGSIGGTTFAHNKGGLYQRSRSIPSNPNTARQMAVRSQLGTLSQAFNNDLSSAQREAWRLYGQNVTLTDTLGDAIQLSGQQMYIRTNTPRLQLLTSPLTGGANVASRVDDAPTTFNTGVPVGAITLAEVTALDDGIQITGDFTAPQPAAGTVLGFVGASQNASRSFFKGPYQLAFAVDFSAAAENFDSGALDYATAAQWAASFNPTGGSRVPLRLVVGLEDGRYSLAFAEIILTTQAT